MTVTVTLLKIDSIFKVFYCAAGRYFVGQMQVRRRWRRRLRKRTKRRVVAEHLLEPAATP